MTFKQLQDAVLADAFAEAKRADVKNWLNFRYTWIFDVDEWTFTQGTALVTVTSGSQAVTNLPSDFGLAYALYKSDGSPLEPVDYQTFQASYYSTTSPLSGPPEAFTVLGSSILVGPTSNETKADYSLAYEKTVTPLSADTDVPVIPSGYHLALVHGAKAEGFKLTNVPLADSFDADFQAAVTTMRRKYLRSLPHNQAQSPAYRPY